VSVAAPEAVSTNPLRRLAGDIITERAFDEPLPPGATKFSLSRTRAFARYPLPILLDAYERFGPIFSIRILHASGVFMLGPDANHYITVSHADNFRWREGGLGDLIPLLGDGMLTIDGAYHRRARRIMLPAFHRERIAAAADVMLEEAERATASWSAGHRLDLYHWTRALALRVAQRALFGFDPDANSRDFDPAEEFERALGFYGRDYLLQILRGPRTPWSTLQRSRRRLDRMLYAEIARRRARGGLEGRGDILSLLMAARDEDGSEFSDRELRDQVMTLLFAGHDTTTSTVTFLFYELARHPEAQAPLLAELDRVVGDRPVEARDLAEPPEQLEMAIDETLRLYPPAWIGPRRNVEAFEFAGRRVPAGAPLYYCSWASHHLADVFDDPEAFRPERFAPQAKAALPKGAYVPFGGGSRTCIGMRFGQMEIRAIAATILRRFTVELEPGYEMSIRQMPTLSPRGGLPVTVRARQAVGSAAA
jgi:cytochrome P450